MSYARSKLTDVHWRWETDKDSRLETHTNRKLQKKQRIVRVRPKTKRKHRFRNHFKGLTVHIVNNQVTECIHKQIGLGLYSPTWRRITASAQWSSHWLDSNSWACHPSHCQTRSALLIARKKSWLLINYFLVHVPYLTPFIKQDGCKQQGNQCLLTLC